MKAKVLIVDDEAFSLDFLQEFLGEWFAFDYARNGREALAAVAAGEPEVILMDVEMPGGMNGYQVCRLLKDNKATQGIPVIFISAHAKPEDRLKAYVSGGDDYVSKPFTVEELKHKIGLALRNQEKRNEWAEKARQAASVAMVSKREAADASAVLGFLNNIICQGELAEIAETTLRTLQQFRIEGAVQLRDGRGQVSRNSSGACTPVEVGVLDRMAGEARIVDLGPRSAFNYERATIIAYNMPSQDPALYGTLKDTVLKIAEVLDARMRSLALVGIAIDRSEKLLHLLQRGAGSLRDIETRFRVHRDESYRIMERLVGDVENSTVTLELGDQQKQFLTRMMRDSQMQAKAVFIDSIETERIMDSLLAELDESLVKDALVRTDTAARQYKSVELF